MAESEKANGDFKMLMPTIIMGLIALILFIYAYYKQVHMDALSETGIMFLKILPLLIFAFLIGGAVKVVMPSDMISTWIGENSGIKGILLGTVAGAFTPGGPYTSMPIAAGLLRSGASIGTMVAYITAWSLWAFLRLPLEIGILGWRFVFIRIASTILFPPLAGIIAQYLTKLFK